MGPRALWSRTRRAASLACSIVESRCLVYRHGTLIGVIGAAAASTGTESFTKSLMNSQSSGYNLQETPSYLAIVKQLSNASSARFAHPPTETAVPHECLEVFSEVRHTGPVLGCPRVRKYNPLAIVDPMSFAEYRRR